jgi:glycerophosphoryl diester phosphodiesterase
MEAPILIAHRGYAKKYPENSLIGIYAALQAGACAVEFDVQFTRDCVPVVLHDVSLKRTTGVNKRVLDLNFTTLCGIVVKEAKKNPERFGYVGVPTLTSVITLFQQWPGRHAFVDIKQEAIDAFGIEKVIKTLAAYCAPIIDRCTLIAYNDLALRASRAMGFNTIGWILEKFDEETMSRATEIAPDYLICNHTKLPKKNPQLWPGPWKWAFYEVTQAKLALELADLGADYIETMAIAEMLTTKHLHGGSCIGR